MQRYKILKICWSLYHQGANLSLNTGSGTINVKGVAGQMTLVADDGTINASDDTLSGSSSLTTNSGNINFDGTI